MRTLLRLGGFMLLYVAVGMAWFMAEGQSDKQNLGIAALLLVCGLPLSIAAVRRIMELRSKEKRALDVEAKRQKVTDAFE